MMGLEFIRPNWSITAIVFVSLFVTIIFTMLSWRYFEKPLIDYGHALTREAGVSLSETGLRRTRLN
jgi:peptidoglycan/LPS O-acetylase OafA/YrhL